MTKIRQEKVEKTTRVVINEISSAKLNLEELIVVISQLLIRVGFTIYHQIENPSLSPPSKIDNVWARETYIKTPSIGSTLIKVGFDIEGMLIRSDK